MPLFHVHGLVASDALHAALGRDRGGAEQIQSALVLADGSRFGRHLVFGCAHDSQSAAFARRRAPGRIRRTAVHPFLQRRAAPGNDGENGSAVRRAGAGSLWNDGSVAPDGVQSPAPGVAQAGLGGTGNRREDRDHGRCRQAAGDRRARRSGDSGTQRCFRLREQSRGECEIVHERMVPHRRSGISRRRGLSDAHRPNQGADQPRRRKDWPARDRRSSAGPSGGCRSGGVRRSASDLGRGSGRCRGAERAAARNGDPGILQRAPGRLQSSQEALHGPDHSAHRHRQDPARSRRQSSTEGAATQGQ